MTTNVLQGAYPGELMCKISGTRDGLLFRFADRAADANAVCNTIETHVQRLADLLLDGGCVKIEGASIGEMDRIGLERRLCTACGAEISVCLCTAQSAPRTKEAKVFRGAVRGGMHLFASGDLTIVGDVHAGALLESGGSITVLGKLSGTAHAGLYGDADAFVAAMALAGAQIRIADARKEKSAERNAAHNVAEIAYLRDGRIEISQYNTKI